MPIFEYVCKKCGSAFEALVQGSQKASCPSCRSRSLQKKFSAFAVAGEGAALAARQPMGPCGTCGDPRGPGACSLN